MSYNYILLDWDGNLAKTLDVWMEAVQLSLKNRDIKVDDLYVARHIFGRFKDGFTELGVTNLQEIFDEIDVTAEKTLGEVELYPDALYVIEELRKSGKRTALITSSLHKSVVRLLDKYEIHHLFDTIVAADDTPNHKPHPEPLEMALGRLDGTKDEAIMIGDSDKDIGAAVNAGIDSILFYPDSHTKFYDLEELKMLGPTHTIDDFRKVIDIVG